MATAEAPLISCDRLLYPCVVIPQLTLGGLLGGHSGLNIHEGRGNAVQLMGRALAAVAAAAGPEGWRLVEVTGGDKRNAIARDASATVLVGGRGCAVPWQPCLGSGLPEFMRS